MPSSPKPQEVFVLIATITMTEVKIKTPKQTPNCHNYMVGKREGLILGLTNVSSVPGQSHMHFLSCPIPGRRRCKEGLGVHHGVSGSLAENFNERT